MGEQKTTDISQIRFSSTVYPSDEDIKLWESLSPEAQAALIKRDLDEAERSGKAQSATMEELIVRVRAKKR